MNPRSPRAFQSVPASPAGNPGIWLGPALLAGLTTLACSSDGSTAPKAASSPDPTVNCPIPVAPTTPSWAGNVYPVLHSATCGSATTSCHGGASAQGHLDYSGTATEVRTLLLTQVPTINLAGWAVVKPGNSGLSWLYEKVHPVTGGQPGLAAGSPTGSQMPLGGSLCQATTDTLQRWIDQGALDN
jgi:hypothetical protein